jgi:hypothetical protein
LQRKGWNAWRKEKRIEDREDVGFYLLPTHSHALAIGMGTKADTRTLDPKNLKFKHPNLFWVPSQRQ